MSETMQARMWGKADLVIGSSKGQQLGLFAGMGPGATLELPDGEPVPAAAGMLQGTLAMAERPPAETWPDPDVPEQEPSPKEQILRYLAAHGTCDAMEIGIKVLHVDWHVAARTLDRMETAGTLRIDYSGRWRDTFRRYARKQ